MVTVVEGDILGNVKEVNCRDEGMSNSCTFETSDGKERDYDKVDNFQVEDAQVTRQSITKTGQKLEFNNTETCIVEYKEDDKKDVRCGKKFESSLQSKVRKRGRDFERKKFKQLERGDCIIAANLGNTNTSTPDLYCMQGGRYPKHRFIEAKINGHVPQEQREELYQIAKQYEEDYDGEDVQIEVFHRTSPRKTRTRKVHTPGQDPEKTKQILEEEFSQKHFEYQDIEEANEKVVHVT